MAKLYFSYVFNLCAQFLAHNSPNSWNFLKPEDDVRYVNKSNFWTLLTIPKGRSLTRIPGRVTKESELLVPHPDLTGGERRGAGS